MLNTNRIPHAGWLRPGEARRRIRRIFPVCSYPVRPRRAAEHRDCERELDRRIAAGEHRA